MVIEKVGIKKSEGMTKGRDAKNMESTYQLSEILEKGKTAIGYSTHSHEPTKSQDATDPSEKPAQDEIQETQLLFNDIEANSILLDERKGINKIHQQNIPVPPLPRGSPMATPPVTNPFNEQLSISTSIQNLLKIKPSKLMDPELRFDISPEAAISNFKLLKSTHFDHKVLCNRGKGRIPLTFGTEFKEIKDLEQLLKRHPR